MFNTTTTDPFELAFQELTQIAPDSFDISKAAPESKASVLKQTQNQASQSGITQSQIQMHSTVQPAKPQSNKSDVNKPLKTGASLPVANKPATQVQPITPPVVKVTESRESVEPSKLVEKIDAPKVETVQKIEPSRNSEKASVEQEVSSINETRETKAVVALAKQLEPVPVVKTPPRQLAFPLHYFENAEQFLSDLQFQGTEASDAFQYLYQWSGIAKPAIANATRVTAVTGNTLVAGGLALNCALNGEKVCLIELAHQDPLTSLLFLGEDVQGVSDMFAERCDLEYLILANKRSQILPNLFVLSQGTEPVALANQTNWKKVTPKIFSLLGAFYRKFNRIILCLPSAAEYPALPEMLKQLKIQSVLAYSQDGKIYQSSMPISST